MTASTLVLATTGGELVSIEQTVVIINDIKLDVDDEVGVVWGDWSGRVEVEAECGTEEETDGRTGGDDSNVVKMGCVGFVACEREVEGVATSESSSVKAKSATRNSATRNSTVGLRSSAASKFETAKLVSRFEFSVDFGDNWNKAGLTEGVITVGTVAFLTNVELIVIKEWFYKIR